MCTADRYCFRLQDDISIPVHPHHSVPAQLRVAYMTKIGGIVAVVAGLIGLILAAILTIISLMLAPVFTSDIGKIQLAGILSIFSVLLCIAIVVLGRRAAKANGTTKEDRRMIGGLLVVCAVAAAALFFHLAFALLMAQVAVGALMVLLDKEPTQDARSPAT